MEETTTQSRKRKRSQIDSPSDGCEMPAKKAKIDDDDSLAFLNSLTDEEIGIVQDDTWLSHNDSCNNDRKVCLDIYKRMHSRYIFPDALEKVEVDGPIHKIRFSQRRIGKKRVCELYVPPDWSDVNISLCSDNFFKLAKYGSREQKKNLEFKSSYLKETTCILKFYLIPVCPKRVPLPNIPSSLDIKVFLYDIAEPILLSIVDIMVANHHYESNKKIVNEFVDPYLSSTFVIDNCGNSKIELVKNICYD